MSEKEPHDKLKAKQPCHISNHIFILPIDKWLIFLQGLNIYQNFEKLYM